MGIFNTIKEFAGMASGVPGMAEKIVKLQQDAMELMEEKKELAERVAELEKQIAVKQSMVFENNRYFTVSPTGVKDGPFCSACWDGQAKMIRLHATDNNFGTKGFRCPDCKAALIDERPAMQGVIGFDPRKARGY